MVLEQLNELIKNIYEKGSSVSIFSITTLKKNINNSFFYHNTPNLVI